MKKEWEVEKENRQLIRETFIALKANSTQFFLFFLLVYWNQSHNKSISTKIYFCIIFFSLPCLPYYSLRYTHFYSFFFLEYIFIASYCFSLSLNFVVLCVFGIGWRRLSPSIDAFNQTKEMKEIICSKQEIRVE